MTLTVEAYFGRAAAIKNRCTPVSCVGSRQHLLGGKFLQ